MDIHKTWIPIKTWIHINTFNCLPISPLDMDITNLKKMPPRALTRLIKLWTPWWCSEKKSNNGVLGISAELYMKKRCEYFYWMNLDFTYYFFELFC